MRDSKAAHLLDRIVIYSHNTRDLWNGCGAIAACKSALVASWYTGGEGEPLPENRVVWSRSLDGGNTWSPPVVMADPPGTLRAADPMLWHDPNGLIHYTYAINDMSRDSHDWRFKHHICTEPAADELQWSLGKWIEPGLPPDFGDVFFFNTEPIRLDNGEWLIPVAARTRSSEGHPYGGFHAAGALISADDGKTWKGYRGPEFEKSDYGPAIRHYVWEAQAFQRDDGTVVMFARTNWGLIHATYSDDHGRTWSVLEPTALPNPSTRFHVRKLPEGPVICLNNPNAYQGGRGARGYLSMHISYDDGRTFSRLVILDVNGLVMYPDADLDPDGHTLHIFYENREDVYYAPLDLREVL